MKRLFFVLILGIMMSFVAACQDQEPAAEPVASPTAEATASPAAVATRVNQSSSAAGSFFAINEVGLGPDGYVALTNFTDVPASLAGLHICQGSKCFALPDAIIAAGETARIAVSDGAGQEGVVATGATLGELRPTDGEIALLAAPEPDNPEAMLLYYQWGSTPHELTQTAIDAGLWIAGGYGPSSQNATRLYKVEDSGLWLFSEE